jgi:two-component system sensor kinase FixL
MNAQPCTQAAIADLTSARKLVELLSRIHPLILVYDARGVVRWTSDDFGSMCSDARTAVGQPLRALLPKLPQGEQLEELRSRFEERGFLPNVRLDLEAPDGARRPLEVSVLPLPESEGEVLFAVIARPGDAPDQPLREDARSILESAPDAILAVDPHGFVRYANAALARLVVEAPENLRNRPLALLAADSRDIQRLLAPLGGDGPSGELELRLRRSEGGPVPVSVTVSPYRSPDGSPGGAILCIRDATAQRRQNELARRNDELEHCVQTLAHDLRSPLVALLGFSRLLRQDYADQLDDTGAHFIDRIEQAGRTMEALIHDLLELSRIGQPGERPSMVDPRAVLLQLHAEVKPRLEAAEIELILPADPPLVFCDRTRLYQVFSNLLGNAIHHMGPCDAARLEVEVVEEDEFHRISVRDNGRGIGPEHHQRIFEVFQSMGSRQDGSRGTGIGLAIVRKIAETHGGRAWVESEPGHGATFHVTLLRR